MLVLYVIAGWLLIGSVVGLIPATLARSKGHSFAAWWGVSILLLGIFAVIPVALLPTYRCPTCQEVVHPRAARCWRCQTDLTGMRRSRAVDVGSDSPILVGLVFVLIAAVVGLPILAASMQDPLRGAALVGMTLGLAVVGGTAVWSLVRFAK